MHDARFIPFTIVSKHYYIDSHRKNKQAWVSGNTTNVNVQTEEYQSEANYLSLSEKRHTLVMHPTGASMIIVFQ